jgi:hypothetical protein
LLIEQPPLPSRKLNSWWLRPQFWSLSFRTSFEWSMGNSQKKVLWWLNWVIPYQYFLRQFSLSFDFSNGIQVKERLEQLWNLDLPQPKAKNAFKKNILTT